MIYWIALLLSGAFSFWLLKEFASQKLRIPLWTVWLVLMLPMFVVVISVEVFQRQPHSIVIIFLLLFSVVLTNSILYRSAVASKSDKSAEKTERDASPSPSSTDNSQPSSASETSSETKPSSPKSPQDPRELLGQGALPASISPNSPLGQLATWQTLQYQSLAEVSRDRLRGCFPWTVYYIQDFEYRPQAIICRGNLRADPEEAYDRIRSNLENLFGEKFLLVLQEGFAGKPFFAIVPNPEATKAAHPDQFPKTDFDRPQLAIGLAIATVIATLSVGAALAGVDQNAVFEPQNLIQGIPYAFGLLAILGAQQLGHLWAAKRHNLTLSLPYFIPVPFFLGTFGAFFRLKGPIPNRKSLFDVSIAGPIAGLAIAIPMLIVGLMSSDITPFPTALEGELFPRLSLDLFDPSRSIILAILAKIVMGNQQLADHVLELSPMAYAGWLGLLVITLNLIPIGQLSGGHIVHAVYGHQMGANIGRISRVLLFLLAFMFNQNWLQTWALISFLISSIDEPALNDVTPLDERRDLLGLFILTLLALVLLPTPPLLQSIL